MDWLVTFHSPTLVSHTIAAWNIIEEIGVKLTLDGQFVIAPAMTMVQQVG